MYMYMYCTVLHTFLSPYTCTCIYNLQERLKQLIEVEDAQSSPSRPSFQPEPEPVKQLYVRYK